MLPITAMPRAAPSSRVASFMAEPAPARRDGTADMIAAVIGDIASAMPQVIGHEGQHDHGDGRVDREGAQDHEAAGDEHHAGRPRCGWRRSGR